VKPTIKTLTLALTFALFANQGVAAPGYNQGANLPSEFNHTIVAVEHGVIANDGQDDSSAIQAIIDSLSDSPNRLTLIQLPSGEINLAQEIHIDKSGVVIAGAGSNPNTGSKIVINAWSPYGIDASNAPDFDKKYWPGFGAFRVETRQKHANEPNYEGSINFHWKHSIEFSQSANEGDTKVKLESGAASKFSVGDLIYIGAASDKAFLDLGEVPSDRRDASHIKTGHMRTQLFNVLAVDNDTNTVTLDRPLEFDIPLQNESGYNSRAMPVTAIKNFGLQDFYLTMDTAGTNCEDYNSGLYSDSNPNGVLHRYENVCAENAIHGIILKWVQGGWVDNVNIEMIGSHPIVSEFAKDITISNNTIDGSWNKGAGGNGYIRGSKLYDSWIHNNSIKNIRHLALQWSATGNIVENNFLNVDLNLHGGWERHNLIRNNTIEVPFEHRSWANGAPEPNATWQPIWVGSGDHASKWSGPTGPNNVFVNNTLKKALTDDASISRWGLFDSPDVEYAVNWDGSKYQHVNIDGNPAATWNQQIAEGVYNQIPTSGVSTIGGSWTRPETENPTDPTDPPVSGDCSVITNYNWKDKQEVSISSHGCLQVDRDLSGKTIQVWDSESNSSCDYRGAVVSVDGTGSIDVTSNYVSTKGLSGTLVQFIGNNDCDFLIFRAY